MNILYMFIATFTICVSKHTENKNHMVSQFNLTSILMRWEEHVMWAEKIPARIQYEELKQIFQNSSYNSSNLGHFYRVYAFYLMNGLDEEFNGRVDYTKIYYWFRQASDFGDKQALTQLGLLGSLKMDGLFNILTNLEKQVKQLEALKLAENITFEELDSQEASLLKLKRLQQYVKYRHLSSSMVDLYFAGLQGEDSASLIMGYKYMKGLGTEANCLTSAAYFQPVLQKHFIDNPRRDKTVFQNRRIDHMLYNTEYFSLFSELLNEEHVHIFEQIERVTKESIYDVIQLAQNYLYGMNGVKRNYNKAFELFQKVVKDTNNAQAKAFLAQMIIEDLGPNNDLELAYNLFSEAANHNESRALNGLGKMHLKGLFVPKDVKKALQNFKKSADLGFSDGHFNYGSLLLVPAISETDANKQQAYNHLNVASSQGHALAQYTLALMFLEGTDFIYSCDMAIKLMHQSSTRLFPAMFAKLANQFFVEGKYQLAFAQYIQAAILGYTSTQGNQKLDYDFKIVNAAILAEQFDGISSLDTQYHLINEKLISDDLHKFVLANQLKLKEKNDAFAYLFADYISVVGEKDGQLTYQERYDIVRDLTEFKHFRTKTIGTYVASKFYGYAKLERDGYSFLRYGDYYYYGIYENVSFEDAFIQYRAAAEAPDTPSVIQANAFFNLGYMTTFGLGKAKNETLAITYFNASIHKHSILPGLNAETVYWLVTLVGTDLEGDHLFDRVDSALSTLFSFFLNCILNYQNAILSLTFSTLALLLYGASLKIQNSSNIHS